MQSSNLIDTELEENVDKETDERLLYANTNMAIHLKVFFSDVPYKRQRLLGLSSKYMYSTT